MLHRYGQFRAAGEGRKRQFVISTESVDRHGTSIRSDAWDLSAFAGTAFYQHSTYSNDPDDALGPARVWMEGSELIGEIDFETEDINPKAEKILKKIDNGTLNNASVGFLAHDGEYKGEGEGRHFVFTKAELTEFSIVGVPSNRDAKLRSAEEEEVNQIIEDLAIRQSGFVSEVRDAVADPRGEELRLQESRLKGQIF